MLKVDVVVGAQYGDEGKGQVALWMADHNPYDVLLRAGGENAEHRVTTREGRRETFHILPSALASERKPSIVGLPAGMTFSLDGLRREVELHKPIGLFVDRNAAIITEDLRESGMSAAKTRGSTFLGVGATMAAKVARNGSCTIASRYLREIEDMGGTVSNVAAVLRLYDRNENGGWDTPTHVLLEASQGVMLSLDHGYYPYCTSRNVTASGALSDCGLNWQDVNRVIMVVKAVPTRVPGNSGPSAAKELSWKEVCARAGRPYEEIAQTADASTGAGPGAGGVERPFEISMVELRQAADLCGPTSIVLTHADWYDYSCLGARQQRHLSPKIKLLAHDIEEVMGAPVTQIRTGPEYNDVVYLPSG